jgi:hypothetical protein
VATIATFPNEALMTFAANTTLPIAGAILILLGILILWRTARYDLKGALIDSVWQLVRGKRTADKPTAIEAKLREIQAETTTTGMAKRAAGQLIGHFVAQALGVVALLSIALGAILVAIALFWT